MNLTINGEPLSREAVEKEYQRLLKTLGSRLAPEELARRSRGLQRQALDYAIGRLLLLNEARRREIRVTPEEIEHSIREITEGCGGETGFQAHLEKLKISPADLRRQLLAARQTEQLIEQITSASPAPAEQEIDGYLKDHLHKFIGEDTALEAPPPPAMIREQARRLLTTASKNNALSAFITELKKSAVIKES